MRVTIIDLWAREAMLHYVSQLANNLNHLPEVQVTVLLPKGSETGLFEPVVSVDFLDVVKDASVAQKLSVPLKLLRIPKFFKTIRQTRPDVVHLNNCHVWYLFTLPWLGQRYPIISTMHDVEPHPGLDDSWRKRREIDTLARFSDRIFVHGELLTEKLIAKYPFLSPDQITVIPLGELLFFKQYSIDVMEEPNTVLFFGRIRAYKGLEYYLEAARLVSQKMPDTKFVIAGDGDLRPYHKFFVNNINLEIDNRYVPDCQIAEYFRRSKIVVLPYTEASQSAVIPVAYAFKKPVVATRVGCLSDIVEDGRTGLMVPPRDAPALAEAMLRLLRDDDLRKTMGGFAHEKLQNELCWDKIASTTLRTYQAVLEEFASA